MAAQMHTNMFPRPTLAVPNDTGAEGLSYAEIDELLMGSEPPIPDIEDCGGTASRDIVWRMNRDDGSNGGGDTSGAFDEAVLQDPTSVTGEPVVIHSPEVTKKMAPRTIMGTYQFEHQTWGDGFALEIKNYIEMMRVVFKDGQYGVEAGESGRIHLQWRGRTEKRWKTKALAARIKAGGWMGDKTTHTQAAQQAACGYEFKDKERKVKEVFKDQEGEPQGDFMMGQIIAAIDGESDGTKLYDAWGTMTGQQGKRTDLQAIKGVLDTCKDQDDFVTSIGEMDEKLGAKAGIQYLKNCMFYLKAKEASTVRADQRGCSCYGIPVVGESGTGKTFYAMTLAQKKYAADEIYVMPQQPEGRQVWMDGYRPRHKCIIFDDFRGNQIAFVTLLQLLDGKISRQFPVKGGFVYVKAEAIIFTSVQEPKEWYPVEYCDAATWLQLERRLTPMITNWPGKQSPGATGDAAKREFMEAFGFENGAVQEQFE